MQISVKVIPRASKNEVVGWMEDVLKVRLQAPPVDGKANRALLRVLSETFEIPVSAIHLLRGDTGRNKQLELEGVSEAEVYRRFPGKGKTDE